MELQRSRLQQNDAILFLLGVNGWCVGSLFTSYELLLEEMGEELTHAFLVTLVLKVHVCHEALRLGITVWAFEQHTQVVDTADVILSDIDDKARISLLLDGNFSTLLLWPDFDSGLSDLNFLLVKV